MQEVRDSWGIAPGETTFEVPVSTPGNPPPPKFLVCPVRTSRWLLVGVYKLLETVLVELLMSKCCVWVHLLEPNQEKQNEINQQWQAGCLLCLLTPALDSQSNGQQERYCSSPLEVLNQSLGEGVKIPLHQKSWWFEQPCGVTQCEDGSAQLVNVHGIQAVENRTGKAGIM